MVNSQYQKACFSRHLRRHRRKKKQTQVLSCSKSWTRIKICLHSHCWLRLSSSTQSHISSTLSHIKYLRNKFKMVRYSWIQRRKAASLKMLIVIVKTTWSVLFHSLSFSSSFNSSLACLICFKKQISATSWYQIVRVYQNQVQTSTMRNMRVSLSLRHLK